MNASGIYSIENTATGKQYIGASQNIGNRFRQHRHTLRKNTHKNPHLQSSFNKHGPENFEFNPLLVCDIDDLDFYEQRCIVGFDAIKNGYNIRLEAGTNRGLKPSSQARKNISDALKGKKSGPSPLRGIPLSAEHCKKVGDAHRGMKRRADTKENISNGLKKFYAENGDRARELKKQVSIRVAGIPRSEETKRKISKTLTGRKTGPLSETTKRKMSINAKTNPNHHNSAGWNKGLKMSKEYCDIMSISRKGKPWSPARRAAQEAKKLTVN